MPFFYCLGSNENRNVRSFKNDDIQHDWRESNDTAPNYDDVKERKVSKSASNLSENPPKYGTVRNFDGHDWRESKA